MDSFVATAFHKNAPVSSRKAALLAKSLKNVRLETALGQLQNVNNKSAVILYKLLKSALANAVAKDQNLDVENLCVDTVLVTKGMTLKRMRPRAMGRGFLIRRKYSHVRVRLKLS